MSKQKAPVVKKTGTKTKPKKVTAPTKATAKKPATQKTVPKKITEARTASKGKTGSKALKSAKPVKSTKPAPRPVAKKASTPKAKAPAAKIKAVASKPVTPPATKGKVDTKTATVKAKAKAVPAAPKPAIKVVETAQPSTNKAGTRPAAAETAASRDAVPTPATAKASKPEPSRSSTTMNAKAATKATVTPITKKTGGSAAAGPANKSFVPYEMKQGEEYMNDAQKEHFKRILLNWRSELMQEVDRTVHHMQDEAANPPDPADRATLEEEFSIELRTRDRERRLIKKIDSTIELIANDDYGYCDSCGVEIGIRRLEARPTANKCIDCKTLDEIKEKQLGSA
jgi:DnaK suppressor protein